MEWGGFWLCINWTSEGCILFGYYVGEGTSCCLGVTSLLRLENPRSAFEEKLWASLPTYLPLKVLIVSLSGLQYFCILPKAWKRRYGSEIDDEKSNLGFRLNLHQW